jgi:protease II
VQERERERERERGKKRQKEEPGANYISFFLFLSSRDVELVLDLNEIVAKYNATYLYVGALAPSPEDSLFAFSLDFEGEERYVIHITNVTASLQVRNVVAFLLISLHALTFSSFFFVFSEVNWCCFMM